jgi:hypothetical protein
MNITREELDDLYNRQRLSLHKIAQKLNIPESTLREWMGRLALPRRSLSEAKYLPLDDEEIERLYTVERHSTLEIAQRFGVCDTTICNRLEARGVRRRDHSEAGIVYPRRDFSGDLLEKAYLQGFRLGDLTVKMNKNGAECATIFVSCGTTRIAQLNLYQELFSPYGHTTVSGVQDEDYAFCCMLNMSFDFLLDKPDHVPEWILHIAQNGDEQPLLAFLAGYTDAEGWFTVRADGRAEFGLSSYDVAVLHQAHVAFNRLDIICPPPRMVRPKGTPIKGTDYITKGELWCLMVYRKASLHQLCQLLEPYLKHAEKRRDMFAVWANVTARGIL